jgi:hypothetical protein
VAAIPAYFILFPIARNLRRAAESYLTRLCPRHACDRESRRQEFDALVEDFRENSGITYFSERIARLEASFSSFRAMAKPLRATLNRFLDVPQRFDLIAGRIAEAATRPAPTFPQVPATDQLSAEHGSLRTARVRLAVSTVILLALISVNTGMLGQILRDLGFIPHDLSYLGIPLYMILAFILTLAEAGLGYVHTAGRPDEPTRVAIWPVAAVCFALVIACVEGFFYSQVAPAKEQLVDLPIGIQIKQATLFFLWGSTLVLVLFSLGTIWSASLERITRSADRFPALVRRLSRDRERFATACERAETSTGHLKERIGTIRHTLQVAACEASSILRSVNMLHETHPSNHLETATARPLATAEVHHFRQLAGLWFSLTVVGVLIVAGSGLHVVGYTFPYLPAPARYFTAIGLSACFVALGLLVPRGELFLEGTGAKRLIASGSLWRARAAVVLLVSIALAFVVLFWSLRLARHQATLWIVVLVFGSSLAAAASQSTATGKGLRLWFHSCGRLLRASLEALARLVVRLVLAGVWFVEAVALALAAPIFLLHGRELPSLELGTQLPEAGPVRIHSA